MFTKEQIEFTWGQISDDRSFWQYHQDNPLVYKFFSDICRKYIAMGDTRLSSKHIIEVTRAHYRWHTQEKLKINNNYTAGYARLFMKEHPQYRDVFEIRQLKSNTNKDI